jgi:hypothetical protein
MLELVVVPLRWRGSLRRLSLSSLDGRSAVIDVDGDLVEKTIALARSIRTQHKDTGKHSPEECRKARMERQRQLVMIATACALVCGRAAHAQICGDANGSGVVTVTDGVNTLRAAAELASDCELSTCDVDDNGHITVTDGVNVLRLAAGLEVAGDCGGGPIATPTPIVAD